MTDSDAALVEDGLMTVAESARFLNLSRSTIYKLMCDGQLQFTRIGRARRIPRRALLELAARGLAGGTRITG